MRCGRYYISFNVWPAGYYYPDYCLGSCTIINKKISDKIFDEALKIDAGGFTMEDVLFTGILRKVKKNTVNIYII
jgi:hypothetical protein